MLLRTQGIWGDAFVALGDGEPGAGFNRAQFLLDCERSYTTGNQGDDLRCTGAFPGTPIGQLAMTTAKFEIALGLLLGKDAAPGIRGVNKR